MEELPPPNRPVSDRRQDALPGGRRTPGRRPASPAGFNPLTDLFHRKARALGLGSFRTSEAGYDGAENSYTNTVFFIASLLLTIGAIGAVTYFNVELGDYSDTSLTVAVPIPQPGHRTSLVAAAPIPEPARKAAPLAVALTTAPPDHRAPLAEALATTPPDRRAPIAEALTTPPPGHRAPLAVALTMPPPEPLPAGDALHLRIVYRSSDAGAGGQIEALTSRLRGQNADIESATASSGPAETEGVVYFFRNDRAGASRIAASIGRLMNRAEPVMLVHADHLPRPGTVEFRIPFRVEKDLSNAGY